MVRAPLDSFLGMQVRDAVGTRMLIYTSRIDHQWPIAPKTGPVPLIVGIRLTNNNPVNAVWFAFGLYFLTNETT